MSTLTKDPSDRLALSEDSLWRAVLARDASLSGAFVYGVRSTGVYCRPGCPSRRPGRDQVVFFATPQAAGFQAWVWQELRAIPYGSIRSYGQIARALGQPRAARAVGRACAANPAALVIPCHRAVGEDGSLVGYRWGLERKRQLLEQERGVIGSSREDV